MCGLHEEARGISRAPWTEKVSVARAFLCDQHVNHCVGPKHLLKIDTSTVLKISWNTMYEELAKEVVKPRREWHQLVRSRQPASGAGRETGRGVAQRCPGLPGC